MIRLRDEIIQFPALRRLDYKSGREVVLAVDTSVIAVGFILSQEGEDGKCYPNCFGSISLTSIESWYSQAKLELYGLFCSLRAVRVFIFGVTNLVEEMDAKYVKGMINNPDLQPNTTINRWITSILLFHFELCHISADRHTGPDGLSCWPPSDDDPPNTDDFEDWLDNSYSFCVTLLNDWLLPSSIMLCSAHLGCCFPCLLPSVPSASICFLLLPIPLPIFVQSYSFVLHSSASEPVVKLDSPTIPWSTKAIAREARIRLIQGFLETRTRPADLSDTEFHSFINSATKCFLLHGSLWHREPHGCDQLVIPKHQRFGLIKEAHDDLGHKGVFTVQTQLLLRFWWPMLVENVKWFVRTCHKCQIRQTRQLHIPPAVPVIGGLFCKAHLDTMVMPRSAGYWYIVQACCALTAYPEWRMLHSENASALTSFIFEDILCHWGALAEIVTDNGPAFVQALNVLADRYNIRHICISPYNSQANSVVKWRYLDVQEAIIKSYQEYNPDSAGTRRDECLVGDSRRQVLVDGDKELKWFKSKLRGLGVNQ